MNKYIKQLSTLFLTVVSIRMVSIFLVPLTDTTEARYANTALIMANLNDWITPFFKYGEPFLGKPPLAFWFQALSFKIFGISDFAPRIPSLIITLATIWLIYKFVSTLYNKNIALLASLIYMSSFVVFILSGVVMTDAFLVFGSTLSLVAFLFVINGYKKYWKYLFFVGAAIGMLTKGPVAFVVIIGVLTLWLILSFKERISLLNQLPWLKGILLMLAIFTPWYIAQEIKNPGFLYYFIIGENFKRFLNTSWDGDKYGIVKDEVRGMIWWFWFKAFLPWGIIALSFLTKNFKYFKNKKFIDFIKDKNISFYLAWSLFTPLFFTLAGNVMAYYVLPSIGGLAILLALYISRENGIFLQTYTKLTLIASLFIPTMTIAGLVFILINPNSVNTEKYLIEHYKKSAQNYEPLYFVGKASFSANYYLNIGKKIKELSSDEFLEIQKKLKDSYFVIIKKNSLSKINSINLTQVYQSKKYILLKNID